MINQSIPAYADRSGFAAQAPECLDVRTPPIASSLDRLRAIATNLEDTIALVQNRVSPACVIRCTMPPEEKSAPVPPRSNLTTAIDELADRVRQSDLNLRVLLDTLEL